MVDLLIRPRTFHFAISSLDERYAILAYWFRSHRMRIITERKLREFCDSANGAERLRRQKVMREWITVVRRATWNSFSDVRGTFNHSDVYCNCTIFDIAGNRYRIIAKVAYKIKVVFIRAVLTHDEYDRGKWKQDCE